MLAVFVLWSATLVSAASNRDDLKAAFSAGKLELTFTAKDSGATLELKMKNLTAEKLLLVIKKGKTAFTIRDNQVFLVAPKAQNVDLAPGEETTVSFPMEQSGPGRWSGGSVTQSVAPQPAKR